MINRFSLISILSMHWRQKLNYYSSPNIILVYIVKSFIMFLDFKINSSNVSQFALHSKLMPKIDFSIRYSSYCLKSKLCDDVRNKSAPFSKASERFKVGF